MNDGPTFDGEGFFGAYNPEEIPPEVRAWLEEQAAQAMAAFSAMHGKGPARAGYIHDAINEIAWEGEDILTDELVDEDHERVNHLMDYVKGILPTPQSWGDLSHADKIRVVVASHYMRMTDAGPGTCVHRDRVERDLIEVADHLDLMDGFGARVGTRVPVGVIAGSCANVWEGVRNDAHFLGSHICQRKDEHPGRCRCTCGVSTTRFR